jgi:hypothetical protein
MAEIELSGGGIAKVDDEDFDLVSQYFWHLDLNGGYAVSYLDPADPSRRLRMHRLIMDPQAHDVVDHIDGDRLNNQRVNLRVCSQAENTRNRLKAGGTSRFKGVSLTAGRKKKPWRAQIRSGDRVRCLGYFADEAEAARAYDAAAVKTFGAFGRLNFPT